MTQTGAESISARPLHHPAHGSRAGTGGGEPDIEAALVDARAGGGHGFGVLFNTYHHRLLRYLRAAEPRLADDLVGEVWVAVAQRVSQFDGGATAFSAWLFAIARNRLTDARRRAARRRTDPVATVERAVAEPFEEAAIGRLEAQRAVDLIVSLLPPAQADVVLLRTLGELTSGEIARMTGRTETWVRVTYHRGLKRLREQLAAE